MTPCPSCGASVPAGETICLECGTELVLGAPSGGAPPAEPTPPPPSSPVPEPGTPAEASAEGASAEGASAEGAAARRACPDCAEVVVADANGLCPVCGHDFDSPVHIDEEAFFAEPPSLDEVRAQRRSDALRTGSPSASAAAPSSAPASGRPAGHAYAPSARPGSEPPTPAGGPDPTSMPLPGDRSRTRYRSGSAPVAAAGAPELEVEGGQSVFFDGRMTDRIRLEFDQLTIGRRDPEQGHYPDVDLTHLREIDGHISRRHARIYRQSGDWVVEDLASNDATFLNDRAHVLNGDSAPLSDGDRVLISDSIALVFRAWVP